MMKTRKATMLQCPQHRSVGCDDMDMNLEGKELKEAFDIANKENYKLKDEDLIENERIGADNGDTRPGLTAILRKSQKPKAVVIGLNPSHAKAGKIGNDQTIPILAKALYGLGFGEFTMLNLYTIREPNSKKLDGTAKGKGGLNKFITKFEVYGDILDEADAIFVVVGKSSLGNDPRDENFEGPEKKHEKAIENMIDALESHATKTWGVKLIDDSDNSTIKWNVHPSAPSKIWTNDHEKKIIERFPVDEYLAWMYPDKQ